MFRLAENVLNNPAQRKAFHKIQDAINGDGWTKTFLPLLSGWKYLQHIRYNCWKGKKILAHATITGIASLIY